MWLQRACGLRVAEVFGLDSQDVNLERHLLAVQQQGGRNYKQWNLEHPTLNPQASDACVVTSQKKTKTPAGARLIGIPDVLNPLLAKHIEARLDDGAQQTEPLFVGRLPSSNRRGAAGTFSNNIRRQSLALVTEGAIQTHDFRKSFITDFRSRGRVSGALLSIIAGHKVGAYDGEALVTARTYTLIQAHPYFDQISEATQKFNDWVHDQTGESLLPVTDPTDRWLTVPEAAERFGLNIQTLYFEARRGHFPIKHDALKNRRRNPGGLRRRLLLHAADLQEWDALQTSSPTLSDAACTLGLAPETVRALARANGIEMQPMNGAGTNRPGHRFTVVQFEQLRTLAAWRQDFLDAHMVLSQAAAFLRISPRKFRRLIALGNMSAVAPPIAGPLAPGNGVQWFTRESVRDLDDRMDALSTAYRRRRP
jgi:hypothetical protein